MKKQFKILSLFLFLGFVLVLVGCSKPVKLDPPVISLDETVLTWEQITNASGYKVKVNDTEYEVSTNTYDLKSLRESSYNITVRAVGDGKGFLDSDPSESITITPANKVELTHGEVTSGKLIYKVKVSSSADVLGFTFDITYPVDKLSITEDKVTWTNVLPQNWLYDVYVNEGHITIAVTGVDPINVRLVQSLINLEFTVISANAVVNVANYSIDNG